MKILDLFSGIGGFSLAADWLGWETVAFCEQDKFCQKVLAKHWPGVPIYDDIKQLKGDSFKNEKNKEGGNARETHSATIDLVCGGFP